MKAFGLLSVFERLLARKRHQQTSVLFPVEQVPSSDSTNEGSAQAAS